MLLVCNSWVPYTRSTCYQSLQLTAVTNKFYVRFVSVTPLYTPTAPGQADNIYITRSYDATSHFETVVDDVQDVWKRMMGKQRATMATQFHRRRTR